MANEDSRESSVLSNAITLALVGIGAYSGYQMTKMPNAAVKNTTKKVVKDTAQKRTKEVTENTGKNLKEEIQKTAENIANNNDNVADATKKMEQATEKVRQNNVEKATTEATKNANEINLSEIRGSRGQKDKMGNSVGDLQYTEELLDELEILAKSDPQKYKEMVDSGHIQEKMLRTVADEMYMNYQIIGEQVGGTNNLIDGMISNGLKIDLMKAGAYKDGKLVDNDILRKVLSSEKYKNNIDSIFDFDNFYNSKFYNTQWDRIDAMNSKRTNIIRETIFDVYNTKSDKFVTDAYKAAINRVGT